MKKEHLIINKANSLAITHDDNWKSITLHSEGTPSWKAYGEGVKTLTIDKNIARGGLHIELEEVNKETGRGKVAMLSLKKETAEVLMKELINLFGEK